MTAASEGPFSIGQVSKLTGMTTHTLRFYEREGLFVDPVRRNESGQRRFTAAQVDWLIISGKLRAAQMPLPEIRRYAEAGAAHTEIRVQLLRDHQQRLAHQLAELAEVVEALKATDGNTVD